MSLAATLGSRLALLISGRLILLIISLAATMILTRQLGPAGFGNYRAAVAYLGLVLVIADFGLASIFVREISKRGADQARMVGSAMALRLLISLGMFCVSVGLVFLLNLDRQAQLGVLAGSIGFVAYSLHLLLFGLFQQRLRQQGAVTAEITGGLVLLAVIGCASVLNAEPYCFVAALGVSYMVTLTIALFFIKRLLRFHLRIDIAQWRTLLRATLPMAGVTILGVVYFRADSVMLALLQPAEAVGLYGVPIKILDSATGVIMLTVGLFAPLVARAALNNKTAFRRYLEDGLGTVTIGAVAGAVLLNAMAVEIVTLLGGADYAAAAPILRLLTILLVLHAIILMSREAVVALHVQHKLLPGYMLGVVTALVTYSILIPIYSGPGAAASLIIAEILVLGSVLRVVTLNSATTISFRIPLGAIGCGVSAVLVIYLFADKWSWIGRASLGLFLYVALLLLTRTLNVTKVMSMSREMLSPRPEAGVAELGSRPDPVE